MQNNYKQYIADVYHCSECFGEKMTEEDMRINLIEWNREADPGDYVPDPALYKQCAAYWNELCERFPN